MTENIATSTNMVKIISVVHITGGLRIAHSLHGLITQYNNLGNWLNEDMEE